jgi:hypothetical protein
MKLSRVFVILQIIILIYMIYKEITTSYTYKHSSDIIIPAILFFVFLIIGLYFKKKEKIAERENYKH